MKKNGVINADISRVLSYMGHTDTIAISDSGFPILGETERIDLAVSRGTPGFMEVFRVLESDLKIEQVILAEEIKEKNPGILKGIQELLQEKGITCGITFISHEELKKRSRNCRAVIRTGEVTPFANVILTAACLFE